MNDVLLISILYEINKIVDKIYGGVFDYSDVAFLKSYIDGYNSRVDWLASNPNSKIYPKLKCEDFGVHYSQNAAYIEFR